MRNDMQVRHRRRAAGTLLVGTLGVALAAAGCGNPQGTEMQSAADASTAASSDPAPGDGRVVSPPAPGAERRVPPSPTGARSDRVASRVEPSAARPEPDYREVVLPAGTTLAVRLATPLASDQSQIEDLVRATLTEPLVIDGMTVLDAGTEVAGRVTDVERSGRVKGRARIAFRFTTLRLDGDEYDIRTEAVERVAAATKSEDATKIGIGAGAGAALGALLGGGSGAAKGAAIGAAAGTGTVLATRGEEVRLEAGEPVQTRLTRELPVRVRVR